MFSVAPTQTAKTVAEAVAALINHATASDIERVLAAGPEAASTYAYQIEALVQTLKRTCAAHEDPKRAAYFDLILAERFRLYYAARESNPRYAAELLALIERHVMEAPRLPDLPAIRAAAEASDVVAHAVRVLKPRDRRLFNALPSTFGRAEASTVAESIGYPPTSAYRRAVPRLHSLGLIERTDVGWAKTVPLLPA